MDKSDSVFKIKFIKLALVYDPCDGSEPQVLDILDFKCVDENKHREQYLVTFSKEQAQNLPLCADVKDLSSFLNTK